MIIERKKIKKRTVVAQNSDEITMEQVVAYIKKAERISKKMDIAFIAAIVPAALVISKVVNNVGKHALKRYLLSDEFSKIGNKGGEKC